MKLLLDTHVWLWSLTAPDRLGRKVRTQLERKGNEVWLSPISVWELLVLAERGRVRLDAEPRAWVAEALERAPLEEAALEPRGGRSGAARCLCRTRIPPIASWSRRP